MPDPTTPTLAWKMEEWGIEMLQAHSTLTGVSIVHHVEDDQAEVNRIVVRATVGERDEGGIQPWIAEMEVRMFLLARDKGLADDYSRAIAETFTDFPTVPALEYFEYLHYLGAEDEDREDNRNTRQRARVFNFHAKEAPLFFVPPTGLMFVPEDDLMFV